MAVDRSQANMKLLREADDVQNKTAEAIMRIQRQAAQTEELGTKTLEELRKQNEQMDDINTELQSVDAKLDHSSALQNKFDKWAFNWLGGKKRAALKEAAAEIGAANSKTQTQVKEVYENEKFDSLTRTWKPAGKVLVTDPNVGANDIFDPSIQTSDSSWSVDYSFTPKIDAEGWTYGYDFPTLNKNINSGEGAPKWNTYVRRRKWKYVQKKMFSDAKSEVEKRNDERKARTGGSKQAETIGYVPRNKQVTLTASGLTVGKKPSEDQTLDAESEAALSRLKAKDVDIDRGIDDISSAIDRLGNIAGTIKEEAVKSAVKIDEMDARIAKANEKQTVVNARIRGQLKG